MAFIEYVQKALQDEGLEHEGADKEWFAKLREAHFPQQKTRDLMRIWERRDEIIQEQKDMGTGLRGSDRKRGEHAVVGGEIKLHKRKTRGEGAGRKCYIEDIIKQVGVELDRWRMGGQVGDRLDPLIRRAL